jgi:hypothetical protein
MLVNELEQCDQLEIIDSGAFSGLFDLLSELPIHQHPDPLIAGARL